MFQRKKPSRLRLGVLHCLLGKKSQTFRAGMNCRMSNIFLRTCLTASSVALLTGQPMGLLLAGVSDCMNGTFSGGYLSKGNHCVGENLYHFEWCTKYRYKMFRKSENKKLCETVLNEVAERHGIKIDELSVMPEHCTHNW